MHDDFFEVEEAEAEAGLASLGMGRYSPWTARRAQKAARFQRNQFDRSDVGERLKQMQEARVSAKFPGRAGQF